VSSPLYVSVSGGIAVGKTTLTSQLASQLPDCQAFIEHPGRNPYLADFYADMPRWAFHSRIGMMALFASHFKDFDRSREVILLDRCIQELITFAHLHVDRGNLSARDFSIYQMLYDGFAALAPPMDVVVYLTCSPTLAVQRIGQRGRAFEREVTEPYLRAVEEYYEQWLAGLPAGTTVLRYNTDEGVHPAAVAADIRACLPR
jgi:deoxyadenosine/deoxycytidine kinase